MAKRSITMDGGTFCLLLLPLPDPARIVFLQDNFVYVYWWTGPLPTVDDVLDNAGTEYVVRHVEKDVIVVARKPR